MTQLAAPALTAAADLETSGDVRLSITPGITGDYRVLYRLRGASAWVDGGAFAGVAATPTTQDVGGLTDGEVYEFVVVSDNGTDYSLPSVALRASPSDGLGSREERVLVALQQALEGITVANGHPFDVDEVYRHAEGSEPATGSVVIWIHETKASPKVDGGLGPHTLMRQRTHVIVEAHSQRPGAGRDEQDKEAKRLWDSICKAIGADLKLGGAALFVSYGDHAYLIPGEQHGWAGVVAEFELAWRHRSDNPSRAEYP